MSSEIISQRIKGATDALSVFYRFITQSSYARKFNEPGVCDFTVGNPQEMPLPGVVEALGKWSVPQDKAWFAYKNSDPAAQAVVAASLREWRGLPFESDDILMTTGAFGAISATLCALINPGDEVIFITPPWFFYESMIVSYGGRAVRVAADRETFDLDLQAIEAAISERTKAIIVNSPNNPTGKIYPPETLRRLASILEEASKRNGRTIYLLSDEAYSRIIYDGREFPSPAAFYPESFLLYTYGKTLLTPGQRIGYIAMSPTMTGREEIRLAIFVSQLVSGFTFPNALLQHALPDLDLLSVDVAHLQRKRDLMVNSLGEIGYSLHVPEGTFYLLVRSPMANDEAFVEILAEHNILCLPGAVVEAPGFFRISLTASDEMIERSLPGFAAALQEAESRAPRLEHV